VTNNTPIDEAMNLWLGVRRSPWPVRDDVAVVRRFGHLAPQLMEELRRLEKDFYGPSSAGESAAPLQTVGPALGTEARAEAFRKMHPQASDSLVEALCWAHSFDTK
jgi:hypothetical protein